MVYKSDDPSRIQSRIQSSEEKVMAFWGKFPSKKGYHEWISKDGHRLTLFVRQVGAVKECSMLRYYLPKQQDPTATYQFYTTEAEALKAALDFMKGFDEPEIQPMMAVPDGYWVMPVPTKESKND
jgi:hypothetical protein